MDIKKTIQESINKLLGRHEETPVIREDIPQVIEALAAQAAQVTAMIEDYRRMKSDQDRIALYIRNNYEEEIKMGKHTGMTVGDVVILYLGREREIYTDERKPTDSTHKGGIQ